QSASSQSTESSRERLKETTLSFRIGWKTGSACTIAAGPETVPAFCQLTWTLPVVKPDALAKVQGDGASPNAASVGLLSADRASFVLKSRGPAVNGSARSGGMGTLRSATGMTRWVSPGA